MNTMNEAVEAVARIMEPALWSDDPTIAHKAARPYTVEAARRDHLKDIAPIIVAARPIIMEEAAGAVMQALWPILGGNHLSAETWEEIGAAVDAAIRAAKTDGGGA